MSELIENIFIGLMIAAFTFIIWGPFAIIIGSIIKGLIFEPLAERSERKADEKKAAKLAEAKRIRDEKEAKRMAARYPSSSGSGSDDRYKSKRQRDHEWYGDHSELNWRDRETAQMYGMDADTYASNYLND